MSKTLNKEEKKMFEQFKQMVEDLKNSDVQVLDALWKILKEEEKNAHFNSEEVNLNRLKEYLRFLKGSRTWLYDYLEQMFRRTKLAMKQLKKET